MSGFPTTRELRSRGYDRVVWTPTSKLLTLLVLGSAVLIVCEARPKQVHDYIFYVTGVVKTEGDAPLQDAEIILEVNGPVYQAVAPVKTAWLRPMTWEDSSLCTSAINAE